jgi:hypothetical protein
MIFIPFAIQSISQEMFCHKSAGTKRERCLTFVVATLTTGDDYPQRLGIADEA